MKPKVGEQVGHILDGPSLLLGVVQKLLGLSLSLLKLRTYCTCKIIHDVIDNTALQTRPQ